MHEYLVTVDLAKRRDFVGIMVFKKTPLAVAAKRGIHAPDRIVRFLDIVHIDKFNDIPYPKLTPIICTRMGHAQLSNNADLLVDGTNVGDAVVDYMREAGLMPIPIISTGGDQVREVHEDFGKIFQDNPDGRLHGVSVVKEIHVPKADLIDAGKILLQQGRVRCAPGIPWADDLEDQLKAFKGEINEGRIRKAEAETERIHDDLVSCFLMGAWWVHREGDEFVQERPLPITSRLNRVEAYEPADYY